MRENTDTTCSSSKPGSIWHLITSKFITCTCVYLGIHVYRSYSAVPGLLPAFTMVWPRRSARQRNNRRPIITGDCSFLLLPRDWKLVTLTLLMSGAFGHDRGNERAKRPGIYLQLCIPIWPGSNLIYGIPHVRMTGDIKNKVQNFDKLYTELLTAQQNACVLGTPDRCTKCWWCFVVNPLVSSSSFKKRWANLFNYFDLPVKRRRRWLVSL